MSTVLTWSDLFYISTVCSVSAISIQLPQRSTYYKSTVTASSGDMLIIRAVSHATACSHKRHCVLQPKTSYHNVFGSTVTSMEAHFMYKHTICGLMIWLCTHVIVSSSQIIGGDIVALLNFQMKTKAHWPPLRLLPSHIAQSQSVFLLCVCLSLR